MTTDAEEAAVQQSLLDLQKKADEKRESSGAKNEKWKPTKKGEQLGGILVRGEWINTVHGETPLITIQTAEGVLYDVWMGLTVLESFIYDEAPAIGSTTLLVYDGKVPNQSGDRSYHAYQCVTDASDFTHWNESKHKMQQKVRAKQQAAMGYVPDAQPVRTDYPPAASYPDATAGDQSPF